MVELHSCIASDSRKFFKRVFYLKQINFITGAPCSGVPGQMPRWPPLIRPCPYSDSAPGELCPPSLRPWV